MRRHGQHRTLHAPAAGTHSSQEHTEESQDRPDIGPQNNLNELTKIKIMRSMFSGHNGIKIQNQQHGDLEKSQINES